MTTWPVTAPILSPTADLTAEQQAVTVRAAQAIAQHAEECEAAQDVTEGAATALRQSGYTRLTLPTTQGGLGTSLTQFSATQATLGEAGAGLALILAMHGHIVGAAFGGRTLPDDLLNALADASRAGKLVNALASEPELGSPSRGGLPRTTATPDGTKWSISGRKTWATGARALDFALVNAATPDSQVGRFWVDLKAEGVTIEPTWTGALALRGSGSHDVVFNGAAATLHAPPSGGHPASAAWFWTAIAATYLGVGWASLHALTAYARQRTPTALGAPIATLPRVQEQVGRIAAELHAARALLHSATQHWDAHPDSTSVPLIGAAKTYATNAAVNATDVAVRTAGGAALTPALPLERLLRDARAGLTHPPSDETAYTAYGLSVMEQQ